MPTLETLIFYSASLFIVLVIELSEMHAYSSENEPLNIFSSNSPNGSFSDTTEENLMSPRTNEFASLNSTAAPKRLPFSALKHKNKNRDLIYAKPYNINPRNFKGIAENLQMHNLKRHRRRAQIEDRFHCKHGINIAEDGRGGNKSSNKCKRMRTSAKQKHSTNLGVDNKKKQVISHLSNSSQNIKDGASNKFPSDRHKMEGITKKTHISEDKKLDDPKKSKKDKDAKNNHPSKITPKQKDRLHKLKKVHPADVYKSHVLVADKNFAVMKGYPTKTLKPFKSNKSQAVFNKSSISKRKSNIQFKAGNYRADNIHKKMAKSKLGANVSEIKEKANMSKSTHVDGLDGDNSLNERGKNKTARAHKTIKQNANNSLKRHRKTQYVQNANKNKRKLNENNESLPKKMVLNPLHKKLGESKENYFHTIQPQSKHILQAENVSRNKNILKKLKSKRKVGLHKNFNVKKAIKTREYDASFRKSTFLKGLGRSLRNANEGVLYDVKDFIMKHFPPNKQKRTLRTDSRRSEISNTKKGILNEIKEFVLNNFHSDRKTKRNSSTSSSNLSKHGKHNSKKRRFEKIHQATTRRSSNLMSTSEATKSDTTPIILEREISERSNFDENVTDNTTDYDNDRNTGEVTAFIRRDAQSAFDFGTTDTDVLVSDSTVNEQATVIGEEVVSIDESGIAAISEEENLNDPVGEIDYQVGETPYDQSSEIISNNKANALVEGEENINSKSTIGTSTTNTLTSITASSLPEGVLGDEKLKNSKREVVLQSSEDITPISDELHGISANSSERSLGISIPYSNPVAANNFYTSETLTTYSTNTFKKSITQIYNENMDGNMQPDNFTSSINKPISSTIRIPFEAASSSLAPFIYTSPPIEYSVGQKSQTITKQPTPTSTVSRTHLNTTLKSKRKSKVSREVKKYQSQDYDYESTSTLTSLLSPNIQYNDYELVSKETRVSSSLEPEDEISDEYHEFDSPENDNGKQVSIDSRENKQKVYNKKVAEYDDDSQSKAVNSPVKLKTPNHKTYSNADKKGLYKNNEEYEYHKSNVSEIPEEIEITDDKSFSNDYSTKENLNKNNEEYEFEDTSELENFQTPETEEITGGKSFRSDPDVLKTSSQEGETEKQTNDADEFDTDEEKDYEDQLDLAPLVSTSASPKTRRKHKENNLKSSKRNKKFKYNKSLNYESDLNNMETSSVENINFYSSELASESGVENMGGYENSLAGNIEDDYYESTSEFLNDEINTERTKYNARYSPNREVEMNSKNKKVSSEASEYGSTVEDGKYDVSHATYTVSLQNSRIMPEITTTPILDSKLISEEPELSIWPTEVNQNIHNSEEEYDYEVTDTELESLNNAKNSKMPRLESNKDESISTEKNIALINNKEARKDTSEENDAKNSVSRVDELEENFDSDTSLNGGEDIDLLRMKKGKDEIDDNELISMSNSSFPVYDVSAEASDLERDLIDDEDDSNLLNSIVKDKRDEELKPLNNAKNNKMLKLKSNKDESIPKDKSIAHINNKEARKDTSEANDAKTSVSSLNESEENLDSDTSFNDGEDTDLLKIKKVTDKIDENELNPMSSSSSSVYDDSMEASDLGRDLIDDEEDSNLLNPIEKDKRDEYEQPSKEASPSIISDVIQDEINPVSEGGDVKTNSDLQKVGNIESFDPQNVDDPEEYSNLQKDDGGEKNTMLIDIRQDDADISEDKLISSTGLSIATSYDDQLKSIPSKPYSKDLKNNFGELNDGRKGDFESDLVVESSEQLPTEHRNKIKTRRGEDHPSSLQTLKKFLNALIREKRKEIRKKHYNITNNRKIRRTREILSFEPTTMSDIKANVSSQIKKWLFGSAALVITLLIIVGIYHFALRY